MQNCRSTHCHKNALSHRDKLPCNEFNSIDLRLRKADPCQIWPGREDSSAPKNPINSWLYFHLNGFYSFFFNKIPKGICFGVDLPVLHSIFLRVAGALSWQLISNPQLQHQP
jgi:hypothetical protein